MNLNFLKTNYAEIMKLLTYYDNTFLLTEVLLPEKYKYKRKENG